MSPDDTSQIPIASVEAYVSQLERGVQIAQRRDHITDPQTRSLLDEGVTAVNAKLDELAAQPEVRGYMIGSLAVATESIEAVEDLRGILPAERLDAEVARHQATVTVATAFAVRHGLSLETAATTRPAATVILAPAVIPVQPVDAPKPPAAVLPKPAVPEAAAIDKAAELDQRTPVNLVLTIGKSAKILRVGTKGMRISLSGLETQRSGRDYSDIKAALLKIVAEGNGREIKTDEIDQRMAAMLPEGSTKGHVLELAREWLKKITYRNDPVFIHNGKKGPGSAYYSNPSMDVTLTTQEQNGRMPLVKPTKPARGNRSATRVIDAPAPRPELVTQPNTAGERNTMLRAANMLTTYLGSNSDLLAVLDVPAPTKQIVDDITRASEKSDRDLKIERVSTDPQKLEQERVEATQQFRALFSQSDLFDSFLANIDQGGPLMDLSEYLMTIEEEQWETIIDQVLAADVDRMIQQEVSNKPGNMTIAKLIEKISLPNGRIFQRTHFADGTEKLVELPPFTFAGADSDDEVGAPHGWADLGTGNTPAPRPVTKIVSRPTPPVITRPTMVVAEKTPERQPSRPDSHRQRSPEAAKSDWVKEFKREIGEAINILEAQQLLAEGGVLTLSQVSSKAASAKMGTKSALYRLVDAGVISRPQRGQENNTPLTTANILAMHLQNGNRIIFSHNSPRLKQALKIIDTCLQAYYDERRKAAAGK